MPVASSSLSWASAFSRRSRQRNRAFTSEGYGEAMFGYVVVRLWLSDRPGSLGQIATRIGEVGGDLVGIDILERDGARAVDELTVELPDGFDPEDLAKVLSRLPGVEVEDLRHRISPVPYAGHDPLDAAVLLAESTSPSELSSVLARGICTSFTCDWCVVLDMSGTEATVLGKGRRPAQCRVAGRLRGRRPGRSFACHRRGCGAGRPPGRRLGTTRPLGSGGRGRSRWPSLPRSRTPLAAATVPCRRGQVDRNRPGTYPSRPPFAG